MAKDLTFDLNWQPFTGSFLELAPGLNIHHAPGHTPGLCILQVCVPNIQISPPPNMLLQLSLPPTPQPNLPNTHLKLLHCSSTSPKPEPGSSPQTCTTSPRTTTNRHRRAGWRATTRIGSAPTRRSACWRSGRARIWCSGMIKRSLRSFGLRGGRIRETGGGGGFAKRGDCQAVNPWC